MRGPALTACVAIVLSLGGCALSHGGAPGVDAGPAPVDARVDDVPRVDARPACVPTGELCNGRDDDCDARVDEDADLACVLPGAVARCADGACAVDTCEPDLADCDGIAETGCEVDLGTARHHCGACGHECALNQVCEASACVADPIVHVASRLSTCAVFGSGRLVCWGAVDPPLAVPGLASPVPAEVEIAPPLVEVSVGVECICGRDAEGSIWCWGENARGQLGQGHTDPLDGPVRVTLPAPATQVVPHDHMTCAVLDDGSVWCWGYHRVFRLEWAEPTRMESEAPIRSLDPQGHSMLLALDERGQVYCSGVNASSQCGVREPGTVWGRFVRGGDIPPLALGRCDLGHCCGIEEAGFATCWGSNSSGELGTVEPVVPPRPVRVAGDLHPVRVATALDASCALDPGRTLWCWGASEGNATGREDVRTPQVVALPGGATAADLWAGAHVFCVSTGENRLWCWGGNPGGEVGDGTNVDVVLPTAVLGFE